MYGRIHAENNIAAASEGNSLSKKLPVTFHYLYSSFKLPYEPSDYSSKPRNTIMVVQVFRKLISCIKATG